MANLEDLGYKSLAEMTVDERLELIRQIRLSRRIPVKKPTKSTAKRKPKAVPTPTADQAAELLKILTGG